MTATLVPGRSGRPGTRRPEPARAARAYPYLFPAALVVLTALSASLTVAFPSLLHGAAVSDGNLRGTAVALLVEGLPVLVAASLGPLRGSARALVVRLGALGYLIYQGVLLCFATPMDNLFLFYVATWGTGVWSTVLLLRAVSVAAFAARLGRAGSLRPGKRQHLRGPVVRFPRRPALSVSSAAMTPVFALVAAVTAAVVARFLRSVDRRPHPIPRSANDVGSCP